MEAKGVPNSTYLVKGIGIIRTVVGFYGPGSVKLITKRLDSEGQGEFDFSDHYIKLDKNDTKRDNWALGHTKQSTDALGRVFSPFGKLEGVIEKKQLVVESSLWGINAAEIKIDGKLIGIVAHPLTDRRFLRKGRKLLPFLIHLSPDLSLDEESLALQAFQFNRISYLLRDDLEKALRKYRR